MRNSIKQAPRQLFEQQYRNVTRTTNPNQSVREKGIVSPDIRAISQLGKKFVKLVLVSYHKEKITVSDVSSNLGVKLHHLNQIEQNVMEALKIFGWRRTSG